MAPRVLSGAVKARRKRQRGRRLAHGGHRTFRATVQRLQASKMVYHVQQRYETSLTQAASYSPSTNTLNIMYDGIDKSALLEEVIHAGQDDYYSNLCIKRNNLSDEVEAKVVHILSGTKDRTVTAPYNSIKSYFATGKKDAGFNNELRALIKKVYTEYGNALGEALKKENKIEDVNSNTVLKYIETSSGIIGEYQKPNKKK